jgi:gliding motility-associated-like protein
MTKVCGLKDGINTIIWTTNDGICGNKSIDTLMVNYQYISTAVTDTVKTPFAGAQYFDVLLNDSLISSYTLAISQFPQHGKLNNLGNGKFVYSASPDYIGQDFLKYKLCSVLCPNECSEAVVIFNIGGDVTCATPSIITPNGDGINDSFIVPCLAILNQYPNNSLSVFNQWGDEIYHASPYNNGWEGTYQGEPVVPGTYYYILDLGNGTKPVAGFLIIKR